MNVGGKPYRAVWMEGRAVVVIDQRQLPHRFRLLRLRNHRETAEAIRNMTVRGAGTIGATAAYGMAQAFIEGVPLGKAYETLLTTRPTAVDLKHALDRVLVEAHDAKSAVAVAQRIADEYVERMQRIAEIGLALIPPNARVLTHCNAGWLAIVDWGSATAPIYAAHRRGRNVFVWVDETRPRCQGARLTSWELLHEGVPHKVIADNAAGYFMQRGEVDLCIVGADRIAANGDTANKLGTYEKAVVARENGIPFYVAAPTSTIDPLCPNGQAIPIEERHEDEVHYVGGERVTPRGARAANPAFDVTPARYITAFITERGIFKPREIGRLWKR
ncbi:MAG: S-methyl-5-thioribose-1-phosphate isomerase [Verrucomicrobiae bacterium]|nr:S-methyl-5-thioribose-1-phosphate isomerase [Verrucomicrobiae bacterium]